MKTNQEFEINELPPEVLSALLDLEEKKVLPDHEYGNEPYAFLARLGLIDHSWDETLPNAEFHGLSIPQNAMTVSDKGRLYLADHRARKRNNFVMGRRYWITTGIALLALVISATALAAEVGLLKLPTL